MNRKHILKAARKLGFLKDQDGIIKRYINEEGAWNHHLIKCKNYIVKSAQKKSKHQCAVLGSGWLLDTPIEFLSNNFNDVYFFDINHPEQIKNKLKKFPNIYWIEEDLTGGLILKVYNEKKLLISDKTKWLNNLKLNNKFLYADFDYVISLNILNQLDILIIDFIKKLKALTDQEISLIRKLIQDNHLNSLPVGKTCLITDAEELSITEKIDW